MSKRIAFFGGSFNPPHVAHQLSCLLALSVGRVDAVWLVPCFQHAFVKELCPFEHRLAMCELAAEPFGERVLVSDIEGRIGGVSRTLHTLRRLDKDHPGTRWVLLIGSDILDECHRWYGWEEIEALTELFVIPRGGDSPGVVLPDLSSTEVRALLGAGESVSGLVPGPVADYIAEHGLYRPNA